MTGLVQKLHDLKLIITTDRRVWSAAWFLFGVCMIWVLTVSWREPEPPLPDKFISVRVNQEDFKSQISEVSQELKKTTVEQDELHRSVARAAEDLKTQRQELDWGVNSLIDKLDQMSDRVRVMVRKVGDQAVEKAELRAKYNKPKSKVRKKRAVDRGDL